MKLLFLILLALPNVSFAEHELLYNVNGEQKLEKFGPGGKTSGEVIWDTSLDGPLPADAPTGYAERYEVQVEKRRTICKVDDEGNPILEKNGKECERVEEIYTVTEPRLRANAKLKKDKDDREADMEKKKTELARKKEAFDILKQKVINKTATMGELQEFLGLWLEQGR